MDILARLRGIGLAPVLLAMATFGWGTNAVASRLAVGEVSPMMLIFLRWGVLVILIPLLRWKEMVKAWPLVRPKLLWVFLMGGCGLSFFNALFYLAAHTTTALNIGLMQGTMPGFIVIGSFFLFGVAISRLKVVGILLSFLGVVIIVSKGSLENLLNLAFTKGDLLMLLACVFYSSFAVGLQLRPKISDLVMMGYFSIAAFLTSIPLMVLEGMTWGTVIPTTFGWQLILYVAIVPSFISQVLFMRGVDMIGPSSAGLYTNLVPVFAALLAIAVLGEFFSLYHFIAIVMVFAGIAVFEYQKKARVEPSV